MLTIAEVAKQTGLSSRTLRVWEQEGLLHSNSRQGAMRSYGDGALDRIAKIRRLKELGLGLKEIRSILEDEKLLREALARKNQEIDEELAQLLQTRKAIQCLSPVEEAGGLSACLGPSEKLLEICLEKLLAEAGLHESARHREFLQAELEECPPEDVLQWVTLLRKVAQLARDEGFSLPFLRGFAPGSLLLRLTGWGAFGPDAFGIAPRNAGRMMGDLQFDVPFSTDASFFAAMKDITRSCGSLKLTAFRSPILDLLAQFSPTGDPADVPLEPEADLLEELGRGDYRGIFGFDEGGGSMIHRLWPIEPEKQGRFERMGDDLRRLAPKSVAEVILFLALRRPGTLPAFELFLERQPLDVPPRLFREHLPEENLGAPLLHEDMVRLIRVGTGWTWKKCHEFRLDVAKGKQNADTEEFTRLTDEAHLNYLKRWAPLTFHGGHIVSALGYSARNLSCRLRDRRSWEQALTEWQQRHGVAWNEIGVATGNISILVGS